MATEAAWLNGNKSTERRKRKCALTSTGLLMEGAEQYLCQLANQYAKSVSTPMSERTIRHE